MSRRWSDGLEGQVAAVCADASLHSLMDGDLLVSMRAGFLRRLLSKQALALVGDADDHVISSPLLDWSVRPALGLAGPAL